MKDLKELCSIVDDLDLSCDIMSVVNGCGAQFSIIKDKLCHTIAIKQNDVDRMKSEGQSISDIAKYVLYKLHSTC